MSAAPETVRSSRSAAPKGWSSVLLVLLATVTVAMFGAPPASAHTGFGSSQPAEGEVVAEPVSLVTIVFTGEANPVGEKFIALDADGTLRTPVTVSTVDDMVFSLRFDPPLSGGPIGIRWNVQAADAHPIEGAFSFTVTATLPATTIAAPPTTLADPITTTPAVATPTTVVTAPADAAVTSLDEFLAVDDERPGETTATFGRLIGFLSAVACLGMLAFAATTLRGSRGEVRAVLLAARVLGGTIAVGSLVEYVGVARIAGVAFESAWTSSPGSSPMLRAFGGVVIALGVAETARGAGAGRRVRPAQSLSAAVQTAPHPTQREPLLVRWRPDSRSSMALVGAACVVLSFSFDGHTVSKGIRPIHALVNSVHVVAGSVWVGGVATMMAVVWARHHLGRPPRAAELIVRFSGIASVALGAVVLAGIAMAFMVLDSFGELTSTQWGKMLLLKSAAVGLAMFGGAYNHFRLLPGLEADPDSPELQSELRSTVTAELILLAFAVVVTVFLVTAAT